MGKHFPSVSSLLKIADLFDFSIDYIMGLSEIKKPLSEKILPNDEVNLLSLYRNLNANHKEKTIAFMQGLSNS